MYGVPSDLDLGFLINQRLIQVCVGKHDLILRFENGAYISVTSCVELLNAEWSGSRTEDFSAVATPVSKLLAVAIESAGPVDAECVEITFDGGVRIRLFDDSEHYESIVIEFDGQITVI